MLNLGITKSSQAPIVEMPTTSSSDERHRMNANTLRFIANNKIPQGEIQRGFCEECAIKHLFADCPKNPDKKGKPVESVAVHTSLNSSKQEEKVPINVITRAQSQKQEEHKSENDNKYQESASQSSKSKCNSWKARKARHKARLQREKEASKVAKTKPEVQPSLPETQPKPLPHQRAKRFIRQLSSYRKGFRTFKCNA